MQTQININRNGYYIISIKNNNNNISILPILPIPIATIK